MKRIHAHKDRGRTGRLEAAARSAIDQDPCSRNTLLFLVVVALSAALFGWALATSVAASPAAQGRSFVTATFFALARSVLGVTPLAVERETRRNGLAYGWSLRPRRATL